MQEVRYHLEGS